MNHIHLTTALTSASSGFEDNKKNEMVELLPAGAPKG